jgi:general secretion pathway protein C
LIARKNVKKNIINNIWVIIPFVLIVFLVSVGFQTKKFLSLDSSPGRDIRLLIQNKNKQSFPKEAFKQWGTQTESFDPHLRLLGTIVGNPSLVFVFNHNSGKKEFYKINDMVNDVRIIGISSGKITLRKMGRDQELVLERNGEKPENKRALLEKGGANEIVLSKSFVFEEVKRANELLKTVKIQPIPDEGVAHKLKGFRIDNVPAGSIFERAGLKSGDMICFIQGQRLESALEAIRIFHSVQNQPEVKVDLMRDNQMLSLRYKVRN